MANQSIHQMPGVVTIITICPNCPSITHKKGTDCTLMAILYLLHIFSLLINANVYLVVSAMASDTLAHFELIFYYTS